MVHFKFKDLKEKKSENFTSWKKLNSKKEFRSYINWEKKGRNQSPRFHRLIYFQTRDYWILLYLGFQIL